jgi:hypothetical protein
MLNDKEEYITNKTAENSNNSADEQESADIGKDIKKRMERYEAKIKSGDPPAGDSSRSEE